MDENQSIELQDATVLHSQPVSRPESPFTLIYNNADGMQFEERTASIPVRVEQLVTASMHKTSASVEHELPAIDSIKSVAKWLKLSLDNRKNRSRTALEINDGVVYDFRGVPPNNIGHLMIHVIPLALHARKHSSQPVKFLFDFVRPPFQKLLDVFDIQPIVEERRVTANFIDHYGFRGLAAHRVLDLFDTAPYPMMPDIFEGYAFESQHPIKEKLFIARRGARGVGNIEAVESVLTPLGYETIYMEDHSIEEQIAMSMAAKSVVAVHGASMCMLAMNPKLDSLIELLPPNVYHDYFPIAYAGKVSRHTVLMPYFDARIPFNGWEKIVQFKNNPFSVDINQLQKALSLI